MKEVKPKRQNWKLEDKTVFTEYSTNAPNQHFMTIRQYDGGQKVFIGMIYRKRDAENKRTFYGAVDANGKPIFTDIPDLTTLKKSFIEHGKELAQTVRKDPALDKQTGPQAEDRTADMKKIRAQQADKEQDREIDH